MKEAAAFSPCHITGFFQIHDQTDNPLHAGSLGAGIALASGVRTTARVEEASKESVQISINGVVAEDANVSKRVARHLCSRLDGSTKLRITVDHHVDVPVGAGFGTSGAGALSLALALNEALDLQLSRIEAAQIAHVAEVECKSGLGTVIAETFGGLELRVKPGAPGIGEIEQIAVRKDSVVVCLAFGPLSTKKSLTDAATRERVNQLGQKLVDELRRQPESANFLKLSRQFAEHVGLLSPKLKNVLTATDRDGFVCSMPMFGESLFTIVKPESLPSLLHLFNRRTQGGTVITSNIDFKGARLLN